MKKIKDVEKYFRKGMIFIVPDHEEKLIVKSIRFDFFGCNLIFGNKNECMDRKVRYSKIKVSKHLIKITVEPTQHVLEFTAYCPITSKGTEKIISMVRGK